MTLFEFPNPPCFSLVDPTAEFTCLAIFGSDERNARTAMELHGKVSFYATASLELSVFVMLDISLKRILKSNWKPAPRDP